MMRVKTRGTIAVQIEAINTYSLNSFVLDSLK